MSFYEILRHIADSYGLIVIFGLYLLLWGWAFRPGAQPHNTRAAHSIFEDQDDG